jgi:predicted 2-oxoglutarate/Fe(II)-dependent dioxygenase YbiX
MTTSQPPLIWDDMHIDDFQLLSAVVLPSRFDSDAIARLRQLAAAAAAREAAGQQARHGTPLHFKYYLQADSLASSLDPALVDALRDAMLAVDAAHWRFVEGSGHAAPVSVRLLEYHFYETGGDLTVGFTRHYDGGSLLTMVVLLSEPGVDFDGGILSVSDESAWRFGSNERYVDVPLRHAGDAVVFPSHKYHNVSAITRGKRNVAVMEIWNESCGAGTTDERPGGTITLPL